MNPRRMHQIRNLPEAQRFQVMAEGLVMMHEHIEYLNQDFEVLCEQGRFRSAAILRAFADEEAAKVMILLDVARAGWGNHQRVEKLLKQAIYHHLSRDLYVRVYEGRPASMQEVREFVNRMREKLYLDGPNSFDWIFRNEIESSREDLLYVDYIETEDGPYWSSPAAQERCVLDMSSTIVNVALALGRLGLLSTEGLKVVREMWHGQDVTDDTHWQEIRRVNQDVLQAYSSRHDIEEWSREDVYSALEHWCFPLFDVDLRQKQVTTEELSEMRNALFNQEFGDWA